MERRKASFLLPVLLVGALGLVFAGGRMPAGKRPGPGGGVEIGGVAPGADGSVVAREGVVRGAGAAVREGRVEGISWLTIEAAAGKLKEVKKPVIIDLYTDWCGWCKQMDKKTYSNKQVAAYLQEKFYTVKIDAETHATINWLGKTYRYNPQYRSNEFALYLTHGRLEFPTTVIIVPGEEPQAIPGYLEPKELELLVKYFGEGAYRAQSFDAYQKSFHASW
jgi:thioredoxin-related protein